MSTRARSAQLLTRTALLLALICLWISGGAALHHTDEPLSFSVGHSAFGHTTAPVSPVACAACEWEQSFSHPPAPAVHAAFLPLTRVRHAVALPVALHSCTFDYTALRGPPSGLA